MRSDLVVVGAGAAGLFAALTAAREGARVTLVSARPLAETASYWAQGGAAAALALDDSPELHLAGHARPPAAGSTRRAAAEVLTDEAPARVRDLQALGVHFDADRHGDLALGLEGGHSARRDRPRRRQRDRPPDPAPAVGRRRPSTRASRCSRAAAPPRCAPDDGRARRRARRRARARPPARRSSPPAAPPRCGRARPTRPARSAPACCSPAPPAPQLADLEFMQFHPTAVVGVNGREGFLISEAVRGEGATLHDAGRRALRRRARAARRGRPRDLQRCCGDRRAAVGLDMTTVDPGRFPNVVAALREAGLDPTTRARARSPPPATT